MIDKSLPGFENMFSFSYDLWFFDFNANNPPDSGLTYVPQDGRRVLRQGPHPWKHVGKPKARQRLSKGIGTKLLFIEESRSCSHWTITSRKNIYTYIHIYIYIYVYMYIYIHTFVYMYTYILLYIVVYSLWNIWRCYMKESWRIRDISWRIWPWPCILAA